MSDALPCALPVWQQLQAHQTRLAAQAMSALFAADPARAQRFSASCAGVVVDYAKNRIDPPAWQALLSLAEQCGVTQALRDLHAGANVNVSERRPALHHALRQPLDGCLTVDGENIFPQIAEALSQIEAKINVLANSGITDIVHIGIGGSYLGPLLASQALRDFVIHPYRLHFVTTLDANLVSQLLPTLQPEKTLVILASKSFRTEEMLLNGQIAQQWLGEAKAMQQLWAVTANFAAARNFGVQAENILPLWSWVGGRYSLWSAIGLPVALQIGRGNFLQLLAGAQAVDQHVRQQPLAQNIPVILGLLNVWYASFWHLQTRAILPYDSRLAGFPAYLQQLEMESNGKNIRQDGQPVNYATSPVIWGEIGTNGQHAFYQLLHQGTTLVPADFILTRRVPHALPDQHRRLWAHCLSQAQLLMTGDHTAALPQRLPGNRPSTVIVLPELTPYYLGLLIALYEYKVFVSATIWQINPFDQWGVEKSKQLAGTLYQQLQRGEMADTLDSSTAALLRLFLVDEQEESSSP